MSDRKKSRHGSAERNSLSLDNEWLFSCPRNSLMMEIAASLDMIAEPITEVTAGKQWQGNWQMANSFMEAYGYPEDHRFTAGVPVAWDSFNDWMLAKQSKVQISARGGGVVFHPVGELVIVRRSWEAAEKTLAFLLDVVEDHVNRLRKRYNPDRARIALVLEGWERPSVVGRVRKRTIWSIQPLPITQSS